MNDRTLRGLALYGALLATFGETHAFCDQVVQNSDDAVAKGKPGRAGRAACARHVASLTLTKAAALAVVVLVLGVAAHPVAVAVALAVDAVSHYWADRRTTLQALARRVGKAEFAQLGDGAVAPTGTGAYALDQSWHIGWLAVAALIASVGGAA